MSSEEALESWARVAERARAAGIRSGVTLSASFGCPFEGEVDPARVLDVATRAAESGPFEIALADTIGAAVPNRVGELVQAVADATGVPIRCHFHNTRNTGLANAVAAIEAGAVTLDASLGGLGGCPFAPGATGNVPTEDLAEMLERMGVSTGIDVQALVDLVPWLESTVGHAVPGALSRAGRFPGSRGVCLP
jgi:hydroxymethylglutaryl-CoA lyase